jgi:hypothetical protein
MRKSLDMFPYKTLGIAKHVKSLIQSDQYIYDIIYSIKIFSFISLDPTIGIMQIFLVKGQTNM